MSDANKAPTLAVALTYEPGATPVVVAKGHGAVAARIVETAA
ncbi:EscU/YscU/HrcU family type III secretion system export apparatus switch protein, partial [Mycobacterium tuberculosis]|nr:EscU/YscU/HrcU family type III secretion system export apparatus switch protein [Mycobacterium tuberculosis]